MKKLIVLVGLSILAVVLLSGCGCKRVDSVTKVETQTFGNCLTAAQDLACNPTPAQQAAAQQILSFVQSGINIASIVTHVPITADQAQLVFSVIQSGGCVLMNDVVQAMAWYSAIAAAVQTQQAMMAQAGKKSMGMAPPDVGPLYHW